MIGGDVCGSVFIQYEYVAKCKYNDVNESGLSQYGPAFYGILQVLIVYSVK